MIAPALRSSRLAVPFQLTENVMMSPRSHALISRRRFLRASASSLAWSLSAPTVLAGGLTRPRRGQDGVIPPPSERLAVGFIGVGWRGNDQVKAFLRIPEAQCVAVSDCFTSRRESTAAAIDAFYAKRAGKSPGVRTSGVCARHADFRDLLARDDIDAVVIATPDHWHVPAALAAIRAGKDVYVEKPLGIAVTWNQLLRRELKRTGRVFQFGTQQRSDARFRRACEAVLSGRIGPLERIEVWAPGMRCPGHYAKLYGDGGSTEPIPVPDDLDYEMWIGPVPMSPYTKDRCSHEGTNHVYDNSLGFIAGWGVHPLDIALWAAGSDGRAPVEYQGRGEIPTKGLYNTISDWDMHCRWANGVSLHFMNTKTAEPIVKAYRPWNEHGTTFFGPEGWVSVDRGGLHASKPNLLEDLSGPDAVRLHESSNHQQDFLNCIKTRGLTVSPFECGFQSHLVSHLSDLAIRLDRKLVWDPDREQVEDDDQANARLARPVRLPWRLETIGLERLKKVGQKSASREEPELAEDRI